MSSTHKQLRQYLTHLSNQSYKEQAIWFLNHCPQVQNLECAEQIYQMYQCCCRVVVVQQQSDTHSESNTKPTNLSEMEAHLILEHAHSPITQCEFRKFIHFLKGIHPDAKTKIFLVDILLCFYFFPQVQRSNFFLNEEQDKDETSPMDDSVCNFSGTSCFSWVFQHQDPRLEKDIRAAQKLLQDTKASLQAAMEAKIIAIENQTKAEWAAQIANQEEEDAKKKYDISILEANLVSQAQEEANVALNHVQEQEAIVQSNFSTLLQKSQDDNLSLVKRNKAKAELALLELRDPLPLRKARIESENALKHLEKLSRIAKLSSEQAEASKLLSIQAATIARDAQDAALLSATEAEYAIPVARLKLSESQSWLEELMRTRSSLVELVNQFHDGSNTIAYGSLFFIDRELKEAAKFLPKSKLEQVKEQAEMTKQSLIAI